jgi:hypothetical protein
MKIKLISKQVSVRINKIKSENDNKNKKKNQRSNLRKSGSMSWFDEIDKSRRRGTIIPHNDLHLVRYNSTISGNIIKLRCRR